MAQELLKNGVNLWDNLVRYVGNSENLHVFAPYVKLAPLQQLLEHSGSCNLLVVRWELQDLLLGSSDLEVFEYCKNQNISLYRNPRLHLKAYVDDYRRCFLGSANISARALNVPDSKRFNYELATVCESLSIDDALYFNQIIQESTLITESIFLRLKSSLEKKEREKIEVEEFDFEDAKQDFLISALPMSLNVQTLLKVCSTRKAADQLELNCALHDLALYDVPLGLTPHEARQSLRRAFFTHPFIKAFLMNVQDNGVIYFGRAKEWIQNSCTDVPTPRRWELTANTRILYDWIVDLGEGKFEVDIPGARSERLRMV